MSIKSLALMVLASAVAAADELCCKVCTEPQEKYLSVDTKRNKCGETCLDPKNFKLFHLFEKNLEKADTDTPCGDRNFTTYSETVTHGFGPIKATLDLYDPAQPSLVSAVPAVNYVCPGSAATIHAQCKQTATVDATCTAVATELKARVTGQYGTWHDPHNNGTYALVSASATQIELTRITGDKKYTDRIIMTLADSGSSCVVSGCSQSQVTSVADFSTNYCNVRVLYCGSKDGCKVVTDQSSSVTDVAASFGAGSSLKDCLAV